jgi:hypothetical protein
MKKNGYAVYDAGTAWAGIPACLKHFGMTEVKEHATMADAFKSMKKGHMAIILFRGGTKGGITWTLGGHFLGCTGYKEKDGKHKLYMRDPGGRDHDGWYTYETTMKGLVLAIWTCTYKKKKKTTETKPAATSSTAAATKKHYSGKYPTAMVGKRTGSTKNVKRWQTFLNWWGPDVVVDGIFGDDTYEKTKSF